MYSFCYFNNIRHSLNKMKKKYFCLDYKYSYYSCLSLGLHLARTQWPVAGLTYQIIYYILFLINNHKKIKYIINTDK